MKNYTRTARNEAEMFRVVVCANLLGDSWLEILQPGQVHPCESYTWAVSPTLDGAREAHEDWF